MAYTIGRCGNCGGDVRLPDAWMGINPPKPTCGSCGATARSDAPTVPMNPAPAGKDRAAELQANLYGCSTQRRCVGVAQHVR